MSGLDLHKVLSAPIITEKSTLIADKNRQIAFKVHMTATKPQIKKAVETLFKVKVDAVQVIKAKGKVKRFGKGIGRRSDWKKAYVSLKEGYDIDYQQID